MDNVVLAMQRVAKLHADATLALRARDYESGERLYAAAVDCIVTVLDPLHADYVDILKGLRTCLSKLGKVEEVQKVDLIISSLCLGQ
jgi:hypothetical protein